MGLVAVIGLDIECVIWMQETDTVMRGGGVNQTGTGSHRFTL
jgi:hypothetical protein